MLIVPLRYLLLVFAILVAWAFNAVVIKGASMRCPLYFLPHCVLILVPFIRIKRRQLPLLFKLAMRVGLMHFSLLFLGMSYTDVGNAAMIVQLGTPFAISGAALFMNERTGAGHYNYFDKTGQVIGACRNVRGMRAAPASRFRASSWHA